VLLAEYPIIFESIMLDFAEVCAHVDHPGLGNPTPGAIWEGIISKRDVGLPCATVVTGGDCEWLGICWQEGETRVEGCREYRDAEN
jgi:hypothetical protein